LTIKHVDCDVFFTIRRILGDAAVSLQFGAGLPTLGWFEGTNGIQIETRKGVSARAAYPLVARSTVIGLSPFFGCRSQFIDRSL
jgi:hypothetical protein